MNTEEILARARVIATQTATDANQSVVIDNLGGLFALLPHVILDVYRSKANDAGFLRSISQKHTVSMTAGVGTVPTNLMRELLGQANFADDDGSLITYFNYAVDYESGQNFSQLGYVMIVGDEFNYTAPFPTTSYTGNLFVTGATTPTVTTTVTFPDEATENDVIIALANAIQGK